jgi:ElaB/YqjD/DUF883 family membrane-anchored ribosome-binding protein
MRFVARVAPFVSVAVLAAVGLLLIGTMAGWR